MNIKMKFFLMALFAMLLMAGAVQAQEESGLGEGTPCPESDFTCYTLTVPLDHFDPNNTETIDIIFAILPASGERKGMFVTVVGGPGYSGLDAADSYSSYFDESVRENFDVVFFDQRGIASSGGVYCVNAAVAYYLTETDPTTPAGEAAMIDAARQFAEDCIAETGKADLLPYLGTRQAIEDLELFRQAVGDDQFWLYGESYGTQFSQTYAAKYPEHLAGLILDGTVDLTLEGDEYYRQQATAFHDVLIMTLEACNEDPVCAEDVGGDAVAFYDDLNAELLASPLTFQYPLANGEFETRQLTAGNLESLSIGLVYDEASRQRLLRGLASAAQGDLVPLARLLYDFLVVDPETLVPYPEPAFSDAVYSTVDCSDYQFFEGTPEERAEQYMRGGDVIDDTLPFMGGAYYTDLPCAFWTGSDRREMSRPAPLVAEGVPTFVLGATADTATPYNNGVNVFSHLANGYLFTTEGGPHVVFGRGETCPDEAVTAFLVDDELPAERETICEGRVTDDYVPVPAADASGYDSPLAAMQAVDDEFYFVPEYYYWDLETPTTIGCNRGGTLLFEPTDSGEQLTLTDCAFSTGFILNGSGTYDYEAGIFTLDVAVSGAAEGNLVYTRSDNDGTVSVTGEYAGESVDLSE